MSVGSYKKSEWFVTLTFFLPKNRRLLYEIPHILRSQGFVVSWRARGRIICVTQLIQCLRSNVTLQHNFSRVFEHVPRAIYQPTAFSTHSSRSTRPIQLNSTQPQIGYLFSQVTPLVCQASLLRETVWTHLPHEAHLTSWPVPKLACPKASPSQNYPIPKLTHPKTSQSPNHLKQTSTDWYSRNSDRRGPRRRMWWRVHRFCWKWLLNFWKYDLPTCRSLNWPTLAWHCTKDY